jgi:two-component system response regulator MprA
MEAPARSRASNEAPSPYDAAVRVLVVEDETKMAALIRRALEREGYAVDLAGNGQDGLWMATENRYDAMVLDVMIPSPNGFEVCRELRGRGQWAPILLLTARDSVSDRVAGLDAGADDYLVKPFALDELLARLRALLRRTTLSGSDDVLRFADLVLEPRGRRVTRSDRPLELTKTEFDLLELFMINPGIVLDRDTIYDRIWGFDFETHSRSLDVYIGYLRRKTEADGVPRLLHTVRGVGYVLREP